MPVKLSNNAASRLASSLSVGATSLLVLDGSSFPSLSAGEWFPVTAIKDNGDLEIMRCTERSGNTLTVSRAQEGTAALAFDSGTRVELRVTAAALDDLSVVGWTETTTAASKTLAPFERCTVTAAGLTITLPASPSDGDEVAISVGNFTDTLIARNGQQILGRSEDAIINVAYQTAHLYFKGFWRLA